MKLFNSYWLKSGAYSLFERMAQLVFGLGSLLVLTRALGKEAFGIWAIFLVVTTFIEVPRAGILQNGVLKFLSGAEKEEHGKIIMGSFVINVGFTTTAVLLLLVGAGLFAQWQGIPVLKDMFWVYALTTVLLMPFFNLNYIQQANLDFRGIFWSSFVRYGVFFFYVLVIYLLGKELRLIEVVWAQLVAGFFGSATSYIFSRKYLVWSKTIDWDWVKKLFHYGKYVFGTNLATMVHKKFDIILLGKMLSPVASALYDVAMRITILLEAPTMAAAGVVFPQSARTYMKEGLPGVKKLYEKSVGLILAILLPFAVFVMIFPRFVLYLIGGPEFLDAVPLLRLTVLFGFFMPFAVQFGTVLDSIGQPRINFAYTVAGSLLNVLMNVLFIRRFGVIGAAYASLTTYSFMLIWQQLLLNRKVGIHFFNVFKEMFGFYRQMPKIVINLLNKSKVVT